MLDWILILILILDSRKCTLQKFAKFLFFKIITVVLVLQPLSETCSESCSEYLKRISPQKVVPNCERHHVFCLLSSSKMTFCCKSNFFVYSIPLSWDTNNRCKKLQTRKVPCISSSLLYKLPVYEPIKQWLGLCVSSGLIFRVLQYSASLAQGFLFLIAVQMPQKQFD